MQNISLGKTLECDLLYWISPDHRDTGHGRFIVIIIVIVVIIIINNKTEIWEIVVWLTREESNIDTERYPDLLCIPISTDKQSTQKCNFSDNNVTSAQNIDFAILLN